MTGTPCDSCALSASRRDFLRQGGAATMGALLAAGIPTALAAAVPPEIIMALRHVGADPSYPIPARDGVQIDRKEQVILVRWKDAVFAFNLSCPHQNTAVRWNDGNTEFQCPKHHSRYKPDGTFIDGRATRNMDRFSLTRAGDDVVVHVNAMHKNDVDSAGWTSSAIQLSGGA